MPSSPFITIHSNPTAHSQVPPDINFPLNILFYIEISCIMEVKCVVNSIAIMLSLNTITWIYIEQWNTCRGDILLQTKLIEDKDTGDSPDLRQ